MSRTPLWNVLYEATVTMLSSLKVAELTGQIYTAEAAEAVLKEQRDPGFACSYYIASVREDGKNNNKLLCLVTWMGFAFILTNWHSRIPFRADQA